MDNLFARIESLCQKNGIRPGRLCDELGLSRGLMTDLTESGSAADILDRVDVAFYGEYKELDEEDKETVRDMVRLMRERRAANQRN